MSRLRADLRIAKAKRTDDLSSVLEDELTPAYASGMARAPHRADERSWSAPAADASVAAEDEADTFRARHDGPTENGSDPRPQRTPKEKRSDLSAVVEDELASGRASGMARAPRRADERPWSAPAADGSAGAEDDTHTVGGRHDDPSENGSDPRPQRVLTAREDDVHDKVVPGH